MGEKIVGNLRGRHAFGSIGGFADRTGLLFSRGVSSKERDVPALQTLDARILIDALLVLLVF